MTGHNYPDDLYADALSRAATEVGRPTGAYRSTQPVDPVTKPAHYQRAGIETIDYIRATLGDGFEAYCIGNVLKYVSRYREKGGIEDLRKAQVYLGWAIEPVKAEPKNPAAMREAKIAYDVAREWPTPQRLKVERIPKWSPEWAAQVQRAGENLGCGGMQPPNCDGLSARDVRAPHPMQAETIRDHDERLSGPEDEL